jgi:hypothetical protein
MTGRVLVGASSLTLIYHSSFCEEDYAVTFWVAEFINSFTNIAYGKSNYIENKRIPRIPALTQEL